MAKTGVIYGINGPVVSLAGDPGFQMNEMFQPSVACSQKAFLPAARQC